jgi:hypothetical protein
MIVERPHDLAVVADADSLGGSCAGHVDRGEGTAPVGEPVVDAGSGEAVLADDLPAVADAVDERGGRAGHLDGGEGAAPVGEPWILPVLSM